MSGNAKPSETAKAETFNSESAKATAGDAKIEVGAGDRAHIDDIWNFDDLGDESGQRATTDIESSPRTAEEKTQIEKEIKQSDLLKEELDGEEGDEEVETEDEAETEEVETDEDSKDDEKGEEEGDASDKEGQGEPKLLEVTVDGKVTKVPENGIIKVKVNGKLQDVNLKELSENYSGKQHWQKKYNELDLEKKVVSKEKAEFQEDKQKVQGLIDSFYTRAEKNDYQGALAVLAEAGGMDPIQFIKSFNGNIIKSYEQWEKLSQDQRKQVQLQMENNFLESQRGYNKEQETKRQVQAEIQERVKKVVEATGASKEDLGKIYEEEYQKGNQNLTVEEIGNIYIGRQLNSKVSEIVSDVNPDLNEQESSALIQQLVKVIEVNPDFSEKDLKDILKERFAVKDKRKKKSKAKTVSAKIRKGQSIKAKTKQETKSREPSTALTFDDLDLI